MALTNYQIIRYRLLVLVSVVCFAWAHLALASISGKDLLSQGPIEISQGKKGLVVVFLSAKCPCSNSHIKILKDLAESFKSFAFVAVHSNKDEPRDLATSYFKSAKLPFPVIDDSDSRLMNQFKALKTPHAFLIGPDGRILYKGGVTSSSSGEEAETHFLRDALVDVDNGRAVNLAAGRTLGCIISRGEKNVW